MLFTNIHHFFLYHFFIPSIATIFNLLEHGTFKSINLPLRKISEIYFSKLSLSYPRREGKKKEREREEKKKKMRGKKKRKDIFHQ